MSEDTVLNEVHAADCLLIVENIPRSYPSFALLIKRQLYSGQVHSICSLTKSPTDLFMVRLPNSTMVTGLNG